MTVQRRREKWVDFINSKPADKWELNKNTSVCSVHFTRYCFLRKVLVPGTTPRLIVDEIGVVPHPTKLETKKARARCLLEQEERKDKIKRPKLFTWVLNLT